MKNLNQKSDLKALFMANHVKILVSMHSSKESMSNRRIYLKVIVHQVPICLSTFYKYLRMSTAEYPALMNEYARIQSEKPNVN